jgi:hypothetical protein
LGRQCGRVRELNENLIGRAKESGGANLPTYETAVKTVILRRAAVGQSQIGWVSTVANTQPKLVEEIALADPKTARDALK